MTALIILVCEKKMYLRMSRTCAKPVYMERSVRLFVRSLNKGNNGTIFVTSLV